MPTCLIDSASYGKRAAADSRLPDRQCVSGGMVTTLPHLRSDLQAD